MDRSVAHGHVEAARMAAVDIREASLQGSAQTVADVLVGPQRVGVDPVRSVDLAAGHVLRAEVGDVAGAGIALERGGGVADVVRRHERGEGRVRAGPVRRGVGEDALTHRRITGRRALPEEDRVGQAILDAAQGRVGVPSELGVTEARPRRRTGMDDGPREHHAHLDADALRRGPEITGAQPLQIE